MSHMFGMEFRFNDRHDHIPPQQDNILSARSRSPASPVSPNESPNSPALGTIVEKTVMAQGTATPTGPKEVFEVAQALRAKGDFLRAAHKLEYVSAMMPEWIRPKTALIEIYSELHDWTSCVAIAKRFVASHPELVTAHCTHAWALKELRRYEEAVDVCSAGIELFPSSAKLYKIRGECHYDNKCYKQATADFHKSVELHRRQTLQTGGIENGLKPWKRHPWRLR
mmetsp:Transcript_27728/g.27960  ORF Transcript_27728/g.27960 Transcript_27728/m.27960 type:complete len:225 (-) Transcript_27728:204-878(-)